MLFRSNPPDFAAEVFEGPREYSFNVGEGIHNIRMDYYNIPGNDRSTFETNPVVFAVEIYDRVSVTTGHSKSWMDNPLVFLQYFFRHHAPER